MLVTILQIHLHVILEVKKWYTTLIYQASGH